MFISVDDVTNIDGYCYTNRDGTEERVEINANKIWCSIKTLDSSINIYYNDIPKLVKALEAAKMHYERVINA